MKTGLYSFHGVFTHFGGDARFQTNDEALNLGIFSSVISFTSHMKQNFTSFTRSKLLCKEPCRLGASYFRYASCNV